MSLHNKLSNEAVEKILSNYSGKKRVYTANLLLTFSAGVQRVSVGINVPFMVGKVIFKQPNPYIAAADEVKDGILLYSSINNGIISSFNGERSVAFYSLLGGTNISYENPTTISGTYDFYVRTFTEAGGGAQADFIGKIHLQIEFTEA